MENHVCSIQPQSFPTIRQYFLTRLTELIITLKKPKGAAMETHVMAGRLQQPTRICSDCLPSLGNSSITKYPSPRFALIANCHVQSFPRHGIFAESRS